MSNYIGYADCNRCYGRGWVGEGPGGCQDQCAECAMRKTREAGQSRITQLEAREAQSVAVIKAQRERIAEQDALLKQISDARLDWGLACQHKCAACDEFDEKLRVALGKLSGGSNEG